MAAEVGFWDGFAFFIVGGVGAAAYFGSLLFIEGSIKKIKVEEMTVPLKYTALIFILLGGTFALMVELNAGKPFTFTNNILKIFLLGVGWQSFMSGFVSSAKSADKIRDLKTSTATIESLRKDVEKWEQRFNEIMKAKLVNP
jgi:hypothetical protein